MNNQKYGGRENYELRTYLDDKNNASFSVILVTLKRIFNVAFFVSLQSFSNSFRIFVN